jgi:hypothetical protein
MHLYHALLQKKKSLDEAVDITQLEDADLPAAPQGAVEEILGVRKADPKRAARLAYALARRPEGKRQLVAAARPLITVKATGDVHDLKFPVAVFEDLDLVSPAWQPHLLADAVYSFWGSGEPDSPVSQQVREAVKRL